MGMRSRPAHSFAARCREGMQCMSASLRILQTGKLTLIRAICSQSVKLAFRPQTRHAAVIQCGPAVSLAGLTSRSLPDSRHLPTTDPKLATNRFCHLHAAIAVYMLFVPRPQPKNPQRDGHTPCFTLIKLHLPTIRLFIFPTYNKTKQFALCTILYNLMNKKSSLRQFRAIVVRVTSQKNKILAKFDLRDALSY